MIITAEMYEQIRKLYFHEGCSQREIARRLGISRNTVAKYFKGANVPWERQLYSPRESHVITEKVLEFIKSCLDEDDVRVLLNKNILPGESMTA